MTDYSNGFTCELTRRVRRKLFAKESSTFLPLFFHSTRRPFSSMLSLRTTAQRTLSSVTVPRRSISVASNALRTNSSSVSPRSNLRPSLTSTSPLLNKMGAVRNSHGMGESTVSLSTPPPPRRRSLFLPTLFCSFSGNWRHPLRRRLTSLRPRTGST